MNDTTPPIVVMLRPAAALTDRQIAEAVEKARLVSPFGWRPSLHQHPDCVRIAYAWLSAQRLTRAPTRSWQPIKHHVEQWAGRYVSRDDVQAAACLLGIPGRYPNFAISRALVLPDPARLLGIGQAFTQRGYCDALNAEAYRSGELAADDARVRAAYRRWCYGR